MSRILGFIWHLEDIDKLNYLRAQLHGEAKDVIGGLEVTKFKLYDSSWSPRGKMQ